MTFEIRVAIAALRIRVSPFVLLAKRALRPGCFEGFGELLLFIDGIDDGELGEI